MKHTLFILLTVTCAGLFTLSCDSTDAPILPSEYYTDGEVLTIHSHTKGNGIPIVIIGDGFAHSELGVGGIWEQITRSLSNIFIRLEVIKDFADYFDVYAYMAESAESGVIGVNNKFGTNGAIQTTNFALVKSTIDSLPQITDISRASVMFICNGNIGGIGIGTAMLEDDGYGYAICSYTEPNPTYWCAHEFAGHVFGWVIDEYCTGGTADEDMKTQLAIYHAKGKYLNIAATNNLTEVPWKQFFDIPGYDLVGTYEGGYYMCHGFWRSEAHSIMENQVYLHFNAQSRYLIYKRIMNLLGTTFTFDDFLEYDYEHNF